LGQNFEDFELTPNQTNAKASPTSTEPTSGVRPLITQLKSEIDTNLKQIFPAVIQMQKQKQAGRLTRSQHMKNKTVLDSYFSTSNQIADKMRQLLMIVKATNEEPVDKDEDEEGTQGTNGSSTSIKLQVMEMLSPLRLVDVLSCSY